MNAVVRAVRKQVVQALDAAGETVASAKRLVNLSDREFLALLRASPLAEQISEEARAAARARRVELVERKRRALERAEREAPQHNARCSEALQKITALERELEAARIESARIHTEWHVSESTARRITAMMDAELEATCSPMIDELLGRIGAEAEIVRHTGEMDFGSQNMSPRWIEQNRVRLEERRRRLEELSAIAKQVEALKFEALDDRELREALARLEAQAFGPALALASVKP